MPSESPRPDLESPKASETDGELVIRDGREVLRVKKKKRRTKQKKHEVQDENTRKLVRNLVVLSVCVLSVVVAVIVMLMKVNSTAFSRQVSATIASELGGEVQIQGLSVNPKKVSAASVIQKSEGKYFIDTLQLESLSGSHKLYGLVGGTWLGDEIASKKGKVALIPENPVFSGERVGIAHRYNSIRCDDFDLSIFIDERKKAYLKGVQAVKRGTQYSFSRGKLGVSWLEGISNQLIKFDSEKKQAEFEASFDSAQIKLQGALAKQSIDLMGSVEKLSLAKLKPELENFLIGVIDIPKVKVTGSFENIKLEGKFKTNHLFLNIPGIQLLLQELQTEIRPTFTNDAKIAGHIEMSQNRVKFTSLDLNQLGLYFLKGDITCDGEFITANLKFGIPIENAVLIRENKALSVLFDEQKNGKLWTTIRVGGSLDHPRDDVKSRLNKLRIKKSSEQTRDALEDQLESLLNE